MNFNDEITNGAKNRFEVAKAGLRKMGGMWYEEVKHIANELYGLGLTGQAHKFVELAYLHLHNKDFLRYNIVRNQYGGLINDQIN